MGKGTKHREVDISSKNKSDVKEKLENWKKTQYAG